MESLGHSEISVLVIEIIMIVLCQSMRLVTPASMRLTLAALQYNSGFRLYYPGAVRQFHYDLDENRFPV